MNYASKEHTSIFTPFLLCSGFHCIAVKIIIPQKAFTFFANIALHREKLQTGAYKVAY